MTVPKLFTPIQVGKVSLKHRVVLAPLTRVRASSDHVPSELAATYYAQRASTPGSLLISEGTFISPQSGGMNNVPGIWSEAQIAAWKPVSATVPYIVIRIERWLQIVDAVHAKGSFIFMQLWPLGRGANPKVLAEKGFDYVSASSIKRADREIAPRALTVTGLFHAHRVVAGKLK